MKTYITNFPNKKTMQERSGIKPSRYCLLHFLRGLAASLMLMLSGSYSVQAFTTTDANTMMTAYNNAFYVANGGNGYFKSSQTGAAEGFWELAEEIEVVEDANDRTGGTDSSMITSLLNGFSSLNGTSWSGNAFNDDISWACIAYLRGYQATGNTTFRTIAKSNFDMMYARAWDTSFLGGGLWWSTAKTGKNACVQGPAAIAAYLLYQTLSDSSYLTKAQNIFNWEKTHLCDTSSGAVWDSVSSALVYNYWSSTYNQGTFVGAADKLGDTANASLAATFYHEQPWNAQREWIRDHAGVWHRRRSFRIQQHRHPLDSQVYGQPGASKHLFGMVASQCQCGIRCAADFRQPLLVPVVSFNPGGKQP